MGELSDKMAGKAKQAIGKVTDDKKLQTEGKGQEKVAAAEKKIKQTGKRVTDVIDDINEKYSV